ncbi:MAG: hypothetical protein WBP41_16600 [Saprospiraceae bacterium]
MNSLILFCVPGGFEDPDTDDILDLVGIACVPGSIDIGVGCNDVEYTDTATVYLSTYTGCAFTIVYHYYTCSAGSLIDYTMGDFQLLSHNCSAFNSALNSALTAGGATLTDFVENFELAIYNQLQQQIIAEYVPIGSPYTCLHGLFFNIIFIKSSCYYRCFYNLSNEAQSYVKVACGVDCCERHTRVCRDANNALVIETEYVHPSPPYCQDPPSFPDSKVLKRCVRTTSCQYKCLEE